MLLHLFFRHCSESLLSYIEFKQFQQLLILQILESDQDLKILARKMRDSLEITNHKYRFRTYKTCILGTDALHWLMETVTNQNRGEAIDHFVNMIMNGFLMRCTPIPSRAKKAKKTQKDHALYRFIWDIVDVNLTTKPFASIVPPSAIVWSSASIEEKAYRLYRKYVVTDTDLEINVSGSIKKTLAKYINEEEQQMNNITVLAILEVFETLSEEMHKYLEQSFSRMDPIYKPLSAKVCKLLGLKMPSKMKRLHTLQIDEFDKIRRLGVYEMDEVQSGIFLDDLHWIDEDEEEQKEQSEDPSRIRRSSMTLIQAIRHGIEIWHSNRREVKSENDVQRAALPVVFERPETSGLSHISSASRSKSLGVNKGHIKDKSRRLKSSRFKGILIRIKSIPITVSRR